MAKCKSCDKKGLLLKVSKAGLCKDCDKQVTEDITTHSNVIYEEMHVFERAVEKPEKLEALDKILAAAEHLVTYENKGLDTCSPPAKLVLDEYTGFKNDLTKN